MDTYQTYKAVFDASPDAVVIADEEGKIQLANRQAESLFGYAKEELIGAEIELLIPEGYRRKHQDHRNRYTDKPSVREMGAGLGLFARKKDGSEFPVEISLSPIHLPEKRLVAAAIRDVTERKQMEQRLVESEKKFRSIPDNMIHGAMVLGFDWRYLYVNDAMARQSKFTKEKLLGRTFLEMFPHIEQTKVFKVFAQSMKERVINNVENEYVFKDGSKGWFHLSVQPVPEGIFVLSIDISERKIAEELLSKSEKEYRYLFENNPQPMWVYDLESLAFLNVNQAAIQHYGYSKAEFLQMTLAEIRPAETVNQFFYDAAKNPNDYSRAGIWQHQKKNGEVIWVDIILHAIDYNCRKAKLVLVNDITERKKAEELLAQSEQRYRHVVENVSEAIIVDDEEGKVVFANQRFLQLYGFTETELENTVLEDYIAPEYRAMLRDRHNRRIAGEDVPELFEYEGLHKNGSRIWVEVQVSKVIENGVITGTQSAIRDISERKKAELKLSEAMLATQRINKELEQFAYMVSHDLQEPLRMVSGFLNLLQSETGEQLNDEAKEYIHYAADGADRMKLMIEDLLQYSRVGTRKENADLINLNELIQYVQWVLHETIEATGACIQVHALPVIKAGKTLVTLLYQNLISNALKYTGHHSPQIEIGATGENGVWTFYVKDNGIGIEQKYFEKIFIIFKRVHTNGPYTGTGIGLAICKKIVEKYSGKIWVESEPGTGSTFYFTLPDTNNYNNPVL